jgi:hypothetical protein
MILGRRERAFILAALFPRHLDTPRLRELAAAGLAWRALLRSARRAGLAPAVAVAAGEAGVLERAPQEVREALDAELRRNAAQNAALLALLAKVVDRLRSAGVEPLPIKGAALLLLEPALVPLRSVSDVDLLLPADQVDLAASLLVADGWSKIGRRVEIDVRGRLLPQGAERVEDAHGYTLRGPTGLLVELHHALPSAENSPREAADGFFTRASPVRQGKSELRRPAPDDLLAVACEHVLVHHRFHLVHQPRLIIDLDVLLAAGADPGRVRRLWGDEMGAVVDEALHVMEEARRGASAPSWFGGGRAERVLSPAWRWVRAIGDRLRLLAGAPAWLIRALRAHGWRAFFPVRHYMVARYRVNPRSVVVPLLYLWRPVRWVIAVITRR